VSLSGETLPQQAHTKPQVVLHFYQNQKLDNQTPEFTIYSTSIALLEVIAGFDISPKQ